MATITVSDLRTDGSELLLDSESYLNDLTDEEFSATHGGIIWTIVIATTILTVTIPDDAGGVQKPLKGDFTRVHPGKMIA
jgi:hypothetical protein